jgi:Raf kinase inhibitor-like YbhB/YbcL family protein
LAVSRIGNCLLFCVGTVIAVGGLASGGPMQLTLISSAFSHEGSIPRRYTCEGDDISPPLAWSGAPAGTKSFVLVVDDPDAPDPGAPRITWVHWLLYNLPATVQTLPEGVKSGTLPTGTKQGRNDWKRTGYRGPCPPIGRHRYFHKLYALDTILPDLGAPLKPDLERAMAGHILAQADLIANYEKARR